MPTATAVAVPPPQLLLLGGIWVPTDYATTPTAATAGPTLYGAHYYPTPQVPQDYYPGPPPSALVASSTTQFQGHLPTIYKRRQVSPESDYKSGGERSESIEEEREGQGREEEEEEEEADDDKIDPLCGGGAAC